MRTPARERYEDARADTILLSYPKCGRTWLRLMLGEALNRRFDLDASLRDTFDLTPLGRRHGVPRIRVSHDVNWRGDAQGALHRSKARYRRKRVILLVRDPRDVVVSLYFHMTKRLAYGSPYEGSITQFLREADGSLATLLAYYQSWSRNREVPASLLLVRYEDLHLDTAGELDRVLAFLGVTDVSSEIVGSAVEAAAFDRMHALEEADALGTNRLRAKRTDDLDSFKTRRGEVGAYIEYLDADDVAWLEAQLEGLDPWFGYGQHSS